MNLSPHAVINPPVVLSTGVQAVAQSSSSGGIDASRLGLPFRAPMWIDEIRFTVALADSTEAGLVGSAGLFTQAKLGLGRFEITDGFVPIAALTPSSQWAAESMISDANIETAGRNIYTFLRWVLPVPMYVRPGESLLADFRRIADGLGNSARVEMAAAGRVASHEGKVPETTCVPWVTAYTNSKVVFSSSQGSGAPGTTLHNSFKVPLHVQRLVGRSYQDAGSGELKPDVSDLRAATGANVQFADSEGFLVVRDRVVFGEVFDSLRHAWTAPRILPPKGWIEVRVTGAPTDSVYWIAMVGYREEAIG